MTTDITPLREELASFRLRPGRAYPAALRRQVIEAMRGLREDGWTYSAIAEALGMSCRSLQDLRLRAGHRVQAKGRKVELRAVVSTPESPPGLMDGSAHEPTHESDTAAPGLSLTSPTGWRIDGLSLDALVALLARLPC